MKGILISAEPSTRPRVIDVSNGLTDLQGLVGGYIDVVRVGDELSVYINDEGKLIGLPPNALATMWLSVIGAIFPNDYIAGDAVVLWFDPETGEDRGIPQDKLDGFLEILNG